MKTDDQLNDLAAEYANEKHPNPFFSEMRNISAQDYIAGFRAAEQAQQLVLVVERLPEKYQDVIVFGRYTKDTRKTVYEATYDPKRRSFFSDGIKSKDVTHWQPLPLPPQTETGSNHPQG